jgi:hypothetical protein
VFEMIEFARDYLAGHEVPRSASLVPELPKTGSGTVFKREFRSACRELVHRTKRACRKSADPAIPSRWVAFKDSSVCHALNDREGCNVAE